MKKVKQIKSLSVSEQLKAGELLGAEVAKIMNKARTACNKLLKSNNMEVNVQVDFCKLDEIKDEVINNG